MKSQNSEFPQTELERKEITKTTILSKKNQSIWMNIGEKKSRKE